VVPVDEFPKDSAITDSLDVFVGEAQIPHGRARSWGRGAVDDGRPSAGLAVSGSATARVPQDLPLRHTPSVRRTVGLRAPHTVGLRFANDER